MTPAKKLLLRSLAVATAFTALSVLFNALANLNSGRAITDLAGRIVLTLAFSYSWAFEIPWMARFFARYPLSTKAWHRVAYYMAAGLVSATIPSAVFSVASRVIPWQNEAANAQPNMSRAFVAQYFAGLLIFWLIAAIFQTVIARQQVRQLEGQLAQAELQNLKSQLHPHFLFNTLHTISVLQRQDVETANRVLLQLSELLRVSLDHNRAERIPLQQELDFLESYLSIEKTRFQERLRVSIDATGEARAALIPALLLQPFVENAIRHGTAPRASGGSLQISANRNGGTLELCVEDDGAGLAPEFAARRALGSGIRNTEGRLHALFGARARVEVGARAGGGVSVRISLPYSAS